MWLLLDFKFLLRRMSCADFDSPSLELDLRMCIHLGLENELLFSLQLAVNIVMWCIVLTVREMR